LLAMFGLVAATSFSGDRVDAAQAPPRDAVIYTKLYAKAQKNPDVVAGRNVLKHGRAKDGKLSWRVVRRESQRIRLELRISYLDRNPSPNHNREIARLLYPNKYWALDAIFSGESHWIHNVWNGGKLGYDGGNPGYRALSCGGRNYAYGLGQACPPTKMVYYWQSRGHKNPWRVLDSPKMQIIWAVEGYAPAVHGSIEAAAIQWTSGGRNGRTW
jgi:hypothetical protein